MQSKVAELVNLPGISYFNKLFNRYYNVPPKYYKKENPQKNKFLWILYLKFVHKISIGACMLTVRAGYCNTHILTVGMNFV